MTKGDTLQRERKPTIKGEQPVLHLWRQEGGETGYAANLQSYRPEALEV